MNRYKIHEDKKFVIIYPVATGDRVKLTEEGMRIRPAYNKRQMEDMRGVVLSEDEYTLNIEWENPATTSSPEHIYGVGLYFKIGIFKKTGSFDRDEVEHE